MEDLATIGFTDTTYDANENHIISCINWLANFHAKFLGIKSDLLWETGTYWHLETRPDELKVLKDIELKKYAYTINDKLNNAKYQTIVHGDAKLANFCFTTDATKCAAVDFQYIGHGCGMKDLAYFISSAIEPNECEALEEWILNIYFLALKKALKSHQPLVDVFEIEDEWRELYPIAWADFQRFIKGWSPDHFKINKYSENLTKKAIELLKN